MFNSTTQSEDEEALLTFSPLSLASPTSMTPSSPGYAPTAKWRRIPRWLPSSLLLFVVPSFLRRIPAAENSITAEKQPLNTTKKFSTEYLDGVRGVASFIVFFFHWSHIHYPGTNTGYHAKDTPWIWQLPMFRFVYSGAAMVSVFFIVSGYVLTHRYIQKMYRHEYDTLYASLTSLTFRRAIRLFLPALASCILSYACASLGFLAIPRKVEHKKFHHGLGALVHYIDQETNPWTWDSYMSGYYNPQLWSIALEYRGSMVVFLAVLGLARTRACVRVAVESMIIAHAFGHKRWDIALFMAGMLIAEADVFVHNSSTRKAIMHSKRAKIVLIATMIAGIWLSGYPRDDALTSYGYGFLRNVWPVGGYRRRFWLGISAILIVTPMPFLPSLQAVFNTKLIRYLGKISFALYLVHGLGNKTIGKWILNKTWEILGNDGYWSYNLCYVVSTTLYVPIVIWFSDMFWRAVDIPATHFAKWVEGKCASRVSS